MLKNRPRKAVIKVCKLLLLLFMGNAAEYLSAQEAGSGILFSKTSATIREAFADIEAQTGCRLWINHANFDVTQRVDNLPKTPVGLEDALKVILQDTRRDYMIRGNHILIIPRAGVPMILSPAETIQEITEPEPEFTLPAPQLVIKPGAEIPSFRAKLKNRVPLHAFISQHDAARRADAALNPVRQLPVVGIKANLLYGGLAFAPNLAVEFGVSPRSTIDIRGSYNGWKLDGSWDDNKKTAHWVVSAEYRYWLCERFSGHFFGIHGFFGYYNISGRNLPLLFGKNSDQYRFHGNIFGAGISYGYQWILGRRWNLEAQIGAGVGAMKYDRFDCPRCGDPLDRNMKRTYFGPTRAGITFTYLIK